MNMEFFDNKRLLVILSGIASILVALVVFVTSVIGFGNIGAFLGGKPAYTEAPTQNLSTPTNAATPAPTPTQAPSFTPTDVVTTPPVTNTPEMTTPPMETETPTGSADITPTLEPTPTVIPVSSIIISQGATYTMTVGTTVQLTASVLPTNATNQKLTWDGGSYTNIAVVSKDGFVVAMSAGEAWVTVRSENGVWAQIKIVVEPAATTPPTQEPTSTPTAEPTPTITQEPGPTQDPSQEDGGEGTEAPVDEEVLA